MQFLLSEVCIQFQHGEATMRYNHKARSTPQTQNVFWLKLFWSAESDRHCRPKDRQWPTCSKPVRLVTGCQVPSNKQQPGEADKYFLDSWNAVRPHLCQASEVWLFLGASKHGVSLL